MLQVGPLIRQVARDVAAGGNSFEARADFAVRADDAGNGVAAAATEAQDFPAPVGGFTARCSAPKTARG